MTRRYLSFFLIILNGCYVLTVKYEYSVNSELSKKRVTEDQNLTYKIHPTKSPKGINVTFKEDDFKDENTNKLPRTIIHRSPISESRELCEYVINKETSLTSPSCCGSRYNSGSSSQPDPIYNKVSLEGGRYSSTYGDRNIDRYGWQTHGRPPGPSVEHGRPSGGNHGGNGNYAGSRPGDRYGFRPNYGSESSNRPSSSYNPESTGGYSYNSHGTYGSGRPAGHGGSFGSSYGISGTLDDGDDFEPGDPNVPDGGIPQEPPRNIQTQKAVALKALAGVALIGAAAALATNPVLLPIGIVSGRRKRSENDEFMNYIMQILTENFSEVNDKGHGNKRYIPPKCVARLTCEIQNDYLANVKLHADTPHQKKQSDTQLTNLIQTSLLNAETIDKSIKDLIKMALVVSSNGGDCNIFTCNFPHAD